MMPGYLIYWPDLGVDGWTIAVGVWIVAVVLLAAMSKTPKDWP